MKWSDSAFLIPTELVAAINAGSDGTITVGNVDIAAVSYTGADIASNITAVTDIDDPANTGGWTDLVDITGGPMICEVSGGATYLGTITVHSNDAGAGKDLRLQVLVDGTVVGDIKIVSSSGGTTLYIQTLADEGTKIYCTSSFKIRAARKGTFAEAGSTVVTRAIAYIYAKRS